MQREAESFSFDGAKRRGSSPAELVEDLRKRFLDFRRTNARHTRIPEELRAAVLAAVGRGVTPTRIRRTCRVSDGQLTRWKAANRATHGQMPESPGPARIFSVVDDQPSRPSRPPACDSAPEPALELRVGLWSVTVQRTERQEAAQS
jgi:hypothetical protein